MPVIHTIVCLDWWRWVIAPTLRARAVMRRLAGTRAEASPVEQNYNISPMLGMACQGL